MTNRDSETRFPRVDDADLERWAGVWEHDLRPQLPSRSGLGGLLSRTIKRLVRPFVNAATAELWERQRLFNQLVQHHLRARLELSQAFAEHQAASSHDQERLQQQIIDVNETLEAGIHKTYDELITYIQRLDDIQESGLDDLAEHHDAAFALIDHKLEDYRRQAAELQKELMSLIKVAEAGSSPEQARGDLATAIEEQGYLELERRHRGTEEEIASRVEPYLAFLRRAHERHAEEGEPGAILDLGCGRGEALAVFSEQGWTARGVDLNAQMIEQCRAKGLDASVGNLFAALVETPEASLTGVVSFHVIEHLPNEAIEKLVFLAWKALKPGGVLVVETPSPLSLYVGARSFWLDPTHQRPVHPESLKLTFELAGFEQVERIDRQPFPADDRLPEIDVSDLEGDLLGVAHQVNRLRDQLDALVYGFQDFGMVGRRIG